MMNATTYNSLNLQQILKEEDSFSSLSEEPSFTLTDIIEQPPDQDLIDDMEFDQENFDDFFEDQQVDEQQTESKVYDFKAGFSRTEQVEAEVTLWKPEHTINNNSSSAVTEGKANDGSGEGSGSIQILPDRVSLSQLQAQIGNSICQLAQTNPKNRMSCHSVSSYEHEILRRDQRLGSLPIIPVEQIKNMSFVMLKNVTNLFNEPSMNHIGIATCISATGNKFLAIGTSMGNIVLFEIGVKGHKLLGSVEQRKYGQVTSLSISNDNKYLVAGHQSGMIAVWDLYYCQVFKQQIKERAKIMQVLFCSQTSQNFITNDIQGNTYIFTIEKYLWSNMLKGQRLLERVKSPFYDIRYHQLQNNGHSILAMCCLDYVLLISFKPDIRVLGKIVKPEGITSNYFPNVQMGRCDVQDTNSNPNESTLMKFRSEVATNPNGAQPSSSSVNRPFYDVLLVSWGKKIYISRFVPTANGLEELDQLFVYEHNSVVYNMEFLTENIFVTLDRHQVFRTLGFDIKLHTVEIPSVTSGSLQSSKLKTFQRQPEVTCRVINTHQMDEQVIYQRFIKNKENKFIKSFTNTIINCVLFSQNKQIFFITKNSIYRSRLHPWKSILDDLVQEQKNYLQAMKIAVQLANGKLNIFSDKAEFCERSKTGEKNKKYLCQVGKKYLQTGLKNVKQNNIERVQNFERAQTDIKQIQPELEQLYDITIEYYLSIGCENYLFETIYLKVIKVLPSFQYWELFLESLRSFILRQKIRRIPNMQFFKEILDYFSHAKSVGTGSVNGSDRDVNNMELLDRMIINLDTQSLYYEEAVSILSENRLYKSLAYLCSVNKDWISPCNKLLNEIIKCKQTGRHRAEDQYSTILQLYIEKLVNGQYISEKVITRKEYQTGVVRDIGLWLTCQESLMYFISSDEESQSNGQVKNNIKKSQTKFNNLIKWFDKLFEQTSKFKSKSSFHDLSKLLTESLDTLQQKKFSPAKLMKKKKQKSHNHDQSKGLETQLNNFTLLKYEFALILKKNGSDYQNNKTNLNLNYQQISYIVKQLYLKTIQLKKEYQKQQNITTLTVNNNNLGGVVVTNQNISTQLELKQQLTFMLKYFEQLHSVRFEEFKETECMKTPFQVIVMSKSPWVVYMYNFLICNIRKWAQSDNNSQQVEVLNGNITKEEVQEDQKMMISSSVIDTPVKKQSFQDLLVNHHSAQKMMTSSLKHKTPTPTTTPRKIPTSSSNSSKIQKLTSSSQIKLTSLNKLTVSKDIEYLNDMQSVANNIILTQFIIDNGSYDVIDENIESLLKLNSEVVIVYLLDHYDIQMVNNKIQLIQDVEVKYFVVRRILKNLRKKRQELCQPAQLEQRIVWGSRFKSYRTKKQTLMEKKKSIQEDLACKRLSKKTMLFYLRSLAKYKRQNRVYSELKDHLHEEYAGYTEEVLEIMKEFKLNSCIAYVHFEMKQYNKAFEFYQLVYNERFEFNLQKLALVQHCHGRFLRKIHHEMLQISFLIDSKKQWMTLLQAVLEPLTQMNKFLRRKKQQVMELIQKIYDTHPQHLFIQELGEVIETTLLEVSSHISTSQISSIMDQYSELMNKTYMLNCLKSTMQTYSKSIFIYKTSNEMVIQDQASAFEKIYLDHKIRGISHLPICAGEGCGQLISYNDKAVAYKCSHVYHKECLTEGQEKCVKCVLIQVGQSLDEFNTDQSSVEFELLKMNSMDKVAEQRNKWQKKMQEQAQQAQQADAEMAKMNTIYRCLAFDDYLARDEAKFDDFRKDYQIHLRRYE